MSNKDIHYFLFLRIGFIENGTKLEEILKEGYLCYLRNLKAK